MKSWRLWLAAFVLGIGICFGNQASACDFCQLEKGPTLVGEYNLADMVLFGHLEASPAGNEAIDFVIEDVLKPHDLVKNLKRFPLRHRYRSRTRNGSCSAPMSREPSIPTRASICCPGPK